MIIDFHTHTFPDKIADRATASLAEKGGVPYYLRGTDDALRESMKRAGIDFSVTLPVATRPGQAESINRAAAERNGKDGLVCFGGIHPDCGDVTGILDGLKAAGIKGIKLHPDYQERFFDDEMMLNIMYEAAKRDLITVTHAGFDVGYPEVTHCTPDRVLRALDALRGVIEYKLVLAHLGGADFPDEVMDKLCGKPVFFDTSFVLDRYFEKSRAIIEKHGFDRVLFATDSPWADQSRYVSLIKEMRFGEAAEKKLFSANALALLGME